MSEKPGYTPEGQIEDVDMAQEVANKENEARDLEAALAREKEKGLTAEQEINMGVVDYVKEKYPNACKEFTYEVNGKEARAVLVRNEAGAVEEGKSWYPAAIYTRNGVFLLRRDTAGGATPEFIDRNKEDFTERIDWTVENYNRGFGERGAYDLPSSEKWEEFPGMLVSKISISNSESKEFLTNMLQRSEAHFAKQKEINKPKELAELVEGL